MLTPNERYTALVAVAGYLPLTLTGIDYLELARCLAGDQRLRSSHRPPHLRQPKPGSLATPALRSDRKAGTQDRQFRTWQDEVDRAAERFAARPHRSHLVTGRDLRTARALQRAHPDDLTERQRTLIRFSVLRRTLTVGLSTATAVLILIVGTLFVVHPLHCQSPRIVHLDEQVVLGPIPTPTCTSRRVIAVRGVLLGTRVFPARAAGYTTLLNWARDYGRLRRAGVEEGTSSHGTALNRHLARNDVQVIEVNRPDRATRRRRGKTDAVDAAAPPVVAGQATAVAKSGRTAAVDGSSPRQLNIGGWGGLEPACVG